MAARSRSDSTKFSKVRLHMELEQILVACARARAQRLLAAVACMIEPQLKAVGQGPPC